MQLLTHILPRNLSSRLLLAWNRVDQNVSEAILNPDEQTEYESFGNESRRREFLATRRLVRDMVSHLDLDPAHFSLRKDEYGKPFGRYDDATYSISIAHTDGRVLCAIAQGMELGVDMEPEHRQVPDRLRNRVLNADEVSLVNDEATIRLWTIKEALVKLQGKGMRTNLNDCTITSVERNEFTATFNNDNRAKICSFAYENHWLAIALNS